MTKQNSHVTLPICAPRALLMQVRTCASDDVPAAVTRFLASITPQVQRTVAIMRRGMRGTVPSSKALVAAALADLAAQLDTCRPESDSALSAWVSAHTIRALYVLQGRSHRS